MDHRASKGEVGQSAGELHIQNISKCSSKWRNISWGFWGGPLEMSRGCTVTVTTKTVLKKSITLLEE
jgi:hypothetical protein